MRTVFVPVHTLVLCLDSLAQRITIDSAAVFELFDHAFRDECRSAVGVGSQWVLASDWFGRAFTPAVLGILDSERDLVVSAVRADSAAGRPVRAAALWRTALLSMSVRLRDFRSAARPRVLSGRYRFRSSFRCF